VRSPDVPSEGRVDPRPPPGVSCADRRRECACEGSCRRCAQAMRKRRRVRRVLTYGPRAHFAVDATHRRLSHAHDATHVRMRDAHTCTRLNQLESDDTKITAHFLNLRAEPPPKLRSTPRKVPRHGTCMSSRRRGRRAHARMRLRRADPRSAEIEAINAGSSRRSQLGNQETNDHGSEEEGPPQGRQEGHQEGSEAQGPQEEVAHRRTNQCGRLPRGGGRASFLPGFRSSASQCACGALDRGARAPADPTGAPAAATRHNHDVDHVPARDRLRGSNS
jgi:hypothetical protein